MLSKEKQKQIIELNNMQVPKTTIAKQIGCSVTAVYNCLKRANMTDPMIGKTFGKLTVIELSNNDNNRTNRCLYYNCQCECGTIIEVQGAALRSGHTTSCGCSRKNKNINDLTGKQFGKLVVMYQNGISNDRHCIWRCKCECGNECDVCSKSLISGLTKSCGCLHSYKEQEIAKILTEGHINFKREYSFIDLKGKQKPLRFDFAIFDNQNQLLCLIEYFGEQHYNINNSWHTLQLEDSDKRKMEYCKNNQIDLYILNKDDDLSTSLKKILQKYEY